MKKFISLLLALMVLMSCVICVSAADGTVTIRTTDIGFGPGSGYTSTDMFPNFKGVMPGDNLTQKIVIKNDLTKYDYVKVYMQAVPHAAGTNDPEADVSASDSNDFLKALNMTVTSGSKTIYSGHPSSPSDGLESKTLVATINKRKTAKVTVTLEVPFELGNEYMDRIGEVDWEFTVEGFNNPSNGNFKTGDIIAIFVIIMVLALAALIILFCLKKRKKK